MTTETSRDLDAWVAALIGKPFQRPTHGPCCTCQYCGYDYDTCDGECHYSDPDSTHTARLVEDAIERRDLGQEYVYALMQLLGTRETWLLIRATPEQRCRAALAAVGEG